MKIKRNNYNKLVGWKGILSIEACNKVMSTSPCEDCLTEGNVVVMGPSLVYQGVHFPKYVCLDLYLEGIYEDKEE